MATTRDGCECITDFYATVEEFRARCEEAGAPLPAPPLPAEDLVHAWAALEGLDPHHLITSTEQATGLSDTSELADEPFATVRTELGEEDSITEELAAVDANYQLQRQAATELVDAATHCADALSDIIETSTLSLADNLARSSELLNHLQTLLDADASGGSTATVVNAGSEVVHESLAFTQATINDRDATVSGALELFADTCDSHVTTAAPPPPKPIPPVAAANTEPASNTESALPKPAGDGSTGGW